MAMGVGSGNALIPTFLHIPFQQTKAVEEKSSDVATFPPPNTPLRPLRESSPSDPDIASRLTFADSPGPLSTLRDAG